MAVLLGAAVAGSATLASRLANNQPQVLDASPDQPPALMVTADHLGPTPLSDLGAGLPTTTTTTSPTTTTTTSTRPTISTPPSSTSSAPAVPAVGNQVATLIGYLNAIRGQAGCQPLRQDSRLDNSAQAHSQDMSVQDYFSKDSPDGTSWQQRETQAGYPNPGGESIAKGENSAEQVAAQWIQSRRDTGNILNCANIAVGVGVDPNGWYWTADFGQ